MGTGEAMSAEVKEVKRGVKRHKLESDEILKTRSRSLELFLSGTPGRVLVFVFFF